MFAYEMDNDFRELIATHVEHVSVDAPVCPFILGEAGIGKSSIIRAICEEKGWHFFELLVNMLGDRSDITGPRQVKSTEEINGKTEEIWKYVFFPHQEVQDAITCAKQNPNDITVLFLDEINRTSSDITTAIMAFITSRKVGSYKFPNNLRFIAAGNDKGDITHMDTAKISRFVKIPVKPSLSDYLKFEGNLNPYIKQVLTSNPALLCCLPSSIVTSTTTSDDDDDEYTSEYEAFNDEAEGFAQITTPRTISGLNSFLNHSSVDKLTHYLSVTGQDSETGEEISMLQSYIEGHVGKTAFTTALCSVIAQAISSGMMQKAKKIVAPKKPSVYKDIMKCSDRQTRDVMISNMSEEEKSAVLLYAVWEKGVDNSDLITSLARNFNGQLLYDEYQQQFSNLKCNDELDNDNYSALINSNTNIGTIMRSVLGD